MPRVADPECCYRGYHVCTIGQILEWAAPRIFVVETRGECDRDYNKTAWQQARLVRETYWCPAVARLFAADCAERVLPIFEKAHSTDDRPRKAIEATRKFARGEISAAARAAARDAAWDAARAAARDAAWDAAWAAAGAAAWDAARAAACDAACDAARAAACDAERQWQHRRLRAYLLGAAGRKVVEEVGRDPK
jgi:hypothetical protein